MSLAPVLDLGSGGELDDREYGGGLPGARCGRLVGDHHPAGVFGAAVIIPLDEESPQELFVTRDAGWKRIDGSKKQGWRGNLGSRRLGDGCRLLLLPSPKSGK